LETLAIIAYRQPITRPEIDQIRGVSSGEIVSSLLDKTIIEIQGRKEAIGKPLLYGTSVDFLKMFGINAIDELPKLRDLEDIAEQLNSESSGEDILIDVSELPPDLPPDVKIEIIEDYDELDETINPN
jgi:segregation and condensation protein B